MAVPVSEGFIGALTEAASAMTNLIDLLAHERMGYRLGYYKEIIRVATDLTVMLRHTVAYFEEEE